MSKNISADASLPRLTGQAYRSEAGTDVPLGLLPAESTPRQFISVGSNKRNEQCVSDDVGQQILLGLRVNSVFLG